MAVPKKKKSKSKRDMRRAHWKITPPTIETCPQCGDMKQPHHVCPHCGSYKGVEIISTESKA